MPGDEQHVRPTEPAETGPPQTTGPGSPAPPGAAEAGPSSSSRTPETARTGPSSSSRTPETVQAGPSSSSRTAETAQADPSPPAGTTEASEAGPPPPPQPPESAQAELERLRAEVAELRGRLVTRTRQRRRGFAVRRTVAAILAALAGLGLVASLIGLWGGRTVLNTDRWVATVETLPDHPEVTNAVATYLTDEVFSVLNVEQRLAEVLPPRATFLAGPVTGAVHGYTRDLVAKFMASEQFQTLWVTANRFAHARIVAIAEGTSPSVSVEGSTVTLNLLPVVNNLLVTIENQLPTIFGKEIDLPTLSSGEIPAGLHQRIETALGVSLPADFAQIKLYDRPMLGQIQDSVVVFKRFIVLLVAGTLLALVLALWISPHRRRTLLQLGMWTAISAVVLSSALRAVRDQLLGLVPEGMYRQAVSVAVYDIFSDLRVWGLWALWTGVAVAVLCYLFGPGRFPVALRRYVAAGARAVAGTARSVGTDVRLRTWIARYLDVLRIGGIIVAAVVALLFSSWTALFVIAAVLVGYEVLVTLVARGAGPPPDAEPPAGTAAPVTTGRPQVIPGG
ncbi:hypothetical protein ACFFMN_01650 [Planobispora siamensis]|uniref:Integral membrane protein n=1 Tax=Planobispora siamensis TaxID=936338 RepID=A0A8J3SNG2_9ACTN|nr:hypothetical protein [Planobispora siamensis]GIH95725.1 hypothetical protein Psi01_63550 [Planobispora siamensis]